MSRSAAPVLLGVLALTVSLHCRRAETAPRDPLTVEAEDAFVAYLKIDTTNPPGNETAGAVFLRDHLNKAGIDARLVGDDPKRQGVYARLEANPKSSEKALLLLSHIDVVPANAKAWTQPPFSGARSGGYIWGRGALDVKSLTVAQMMALIDSKRRGAKLKRDVVFLAVPDEELGGEHGAKMLLDKHPQLFEGVGYAINEGGTSETAVDRVTFWGIEVHQKVPLWLRLTAEGSGGHGAGPPEDGGASAKLVRALAAIDRIETPYRLTPSVARTAAATAAVRSGEKSDRLRLIREPLDIPRIEREVAPAYRNLLHDSIAITTLDAGYAVNAIPARAMAEVDVRLLPDTRPEAMLARIREAAGKDVTVEVIHAGEPSPESPWPGEFYDVLAGTMRAAEPGSTVGPVVIAGASDSRYLRAKGIATYGIAAFKVNYYDIDSVHGDDERIRAAHFSDGVLVVRDIVRNFCEAR